MLDDDEKKIPAFLRAGSLMPVSGEHVLRGITCAPKGIFGEKTEASSFADRELIALAEMRAIFEKYGDKDHVNKIIKSMEGLDLAGRRKVMQRVLHHEARRAREKEEEHEKAVADVRMKIRHFDAAANAVSWFDVNGVKLEKVQASAMPDFMRSIKKGHCFWVGPRGSVETDFAAFEKELIKPAEIFLIEHDWSAALGDNLANEPFKLPYDVCAFEAQVSGRRVIAFASHLEESVVFSLVLENHYGWVIIEDICTENDGKWEGVYPELDTMIGRQIRAVCIALDAEIATHEVCRSEYLRNAHPNFHAPLKTHHIVRLRNRSRAVPLGESSGTGRKKRLHFRRGHWRHFPAFKTWVKWCLVGDPDLGFVDKEYRL